jgi:hypothetical protein
MNAPTPADFARELATRYGPKPDPTNPFFQPVEVATHRLLLQAVAEVFGPQDPFTCFALAYERAYRLMVPLHWSEATAERLEASLEDMRAAWDVIERDTMETIAQMQG